MNRLELVSAMAVCFKITKSEAKRAVTATTDIIKAQLEAGEKVSLPGFGTFSAEIKAAGKRRNPRTGEEVDIPARAALKFKASAALRDAVTLARAAH